MTTTMTRRGSGLTRREFAHAAASAAAFMIVARYVLGSTGYAAPSEMLNLALIGAGGHGAFLINEVVSYSRGLKAQNCPEADRFIRREYRRGWTL